MTRIAKCVTVAASALSACSGAGAGTAGASEEARPAATSLTDGAAASVTLRSPAFAEGGDIPAKYTCEGRDVSPPLAWAGLPAGTKSVALIVDDPDAPDPALPKRTWVHWVVYDLPPSSTGLQEDVKAPDLPSGGRMGKNDWGKASYGGPCPPVGRHRYFHKLYALDVALPDLREPTKADLEKAMRGHVLATGQLVGHYQKGRGG